MGCIVTKPSAAIKSGRKERYDHVTNHHTKESVSNKGREDETLLSRYDPIEHALLSQQNEQSDYVQIRAADPQAFNDALIRERQQAIDNSTCRSIVVSWEPKSLLHLSELIRTFTNGKSLLDQYWIIFYWIASNINYDTVSYFSGQYGDQSAEAVFRTKRGVCAGYSNLYKYLCDQSGIPCEIVDGYAKGYGFESRTDAPSKTDHAWSAVEIDRHWYLLDSTWGAGHLNDKKEFIRELKPYYFLTRPNEMIYHHLPEEEKWQLLRNPIGMAQYLQIPRVYPSYFELNLELVSPRNQSNVNLLTDKPYALVLVRAPVNVQLTAALKFNNEKIESGHRVVFDHERQLHACYFAPNRAGNYEITIYAKEDTRKSENYEGVIELYLNVKKMTFDPISFPKTWNNFTKFNLEVISPKDTHRIQLNNGTKHAKILIKTPENVVLLGCLTNEEEEKVEGGEKVYFDRNENLWCCYFAPDRDGTFEAQIMAKESSDPGNYTSAVAFRIEARKIPSPPLSYPYTWQAFYDYDLEIQVPKHSAHVMWADDASYAEVLIKAPDYVQLSCSIEYNKTKIENGSLAQFNHTNKIWQLLFAPQRTGQHQLIVYARSNDDKGSSSKSVVRFNLNVSKLRQSMKFPDTYGDFQNVRCQVLTPLNGILNRESTVPFHCIIPGAKDVNLTVDSEWLDSEGYNNNVLERKIKVGSSEVTIWAKFGQNPSYDGLIKYEVQ